jgi:hypothetical protein
VSDDECFEDHGDGGIADELLRALSWTGFGKREKAEDRFWEEGKSRERADFRAASGFVSEHSPGAPSCPYVVALGCGYRKTSGTRACSVPTGAGVGRRFNRLLCDVIKLPSLCDVVSDYGSMVRENMCMLLL